MNKEQLRNIYKIKRAAINAKQKNKWEDLILIQFQKLGIEIPGLIMTYAPGEKYNEFDPQLINDYCYFKNPNHTLLYPVINPVKNTIESVIVNDETLFAPNKFGIDEPVNCLTIFPEEIDLVLVPLLTFDVNGHRVGFGKGYYDRFLKECRDDVVKIGFSFFEAEKKIEGTNKYDVKLDYCITLEKIYSF